MGETAALLVGLSPVYTARLVPPGLVSNVGISPCPLILVAARVANIPTSSLVTLAVALVAVISTSSLVILAVARVAIIPTSSLVCNPGSVFSFLLSLYAQ